MKLGRKGATPAEPRALVAAVANVDFSEGSSWRTWRFGNTKWQAEAWRLYDIVPEFHFLAGRIGDSLAKARLFVTEVSEDGEESGETEDEEIRKLAAIPLGTGAQRDGSLRLCGIDAAVAGEAYIVGLGAARDPLKAEGAWFVVTGAGVKRDGGVVKVRRPRTMDGGGWAELEKGRDILIRCHREHPNDPDQADSFARSAIPVLCEIELLTKREFAELDSRLTGAGMLPLPEGIDFPRAEGDPEGLSGFMAYAQRAAAASMRDQSTAAAMVPIMFTVPDELLDKMSGLEPIRFWSDLSDKIGEMKLQAIERLATSAEIPKETLTGLGQTNHWSGWLLSEEGIRWIGGYLALVADALTRGFLRLALLAMGKTEEEARRFAFAFDTSPLAARPNRLDEAAQLHDRMLLSDEQMVMAGAFTKEQMPDTAEIERRRIWEVVKLQPDLIRDPAVQKLLGLPEVEALPEPPAPVVQAVTDEMEPVSDAIPEQPSLTAALQARILSATAAPALPGREQVFNAAAKLIVLRALEMAGGRLTTIHERRGRLSGVPRHELHHHVGPIGAAKAQQVVDGAFTHCEATALDLGVDPGQMETLLAGYVHELLTRGIRHTDDLLFHGLSIANRGNGMVAA